MAHLCRTPPAPVSHPDLTVAALADLYMEAVAPQLSAPIVAIYRTHLTRFVQAYGDRPARSIVRLDADRHRRQLRTTPLTKPGARPARASGANRAIGILRGCWQWALDGRVIPFGVNPFRLRTLPLPPRVRATGDPFDAVLRNCPDAAFRRLLLAMRYTGASQYDLSGLRADQIDWQNSCLCLPPSRGRRSQNVYFSPLVGRLLRWCIDHAPSDTLLVFTWRDGRRWLGGTMFNRLGDARRRAGAGPDAETEGMSFRNLRQTFVRTALAVAPCPALVRQLMGHRPPGDPSRPAGEAMLEIVRRVEAALRPKRAGG